MSYPDAAEEYRRFTIFEESLRAVTAHNTKVGFAKSAELHAKRGDPEEDINAFVLGSDYALGLNRFSDMSWCVGVAYLCKYVQSIAIPNSMFDPLSNG